MAVAVPVGAMDVAGVAIEDWEETEGWLGGAGGCMEEEGTVAPVVVDEEVDPVLEMEMSSGPGLLLLNPVPPEIGEARGDTPVPREELLRFGTEAAEPEPGYEEAAAAEAAPVSRRAAFLGGAPEEACGEPERGPSREVTGGGAAGVELTLAEGAPAAGEFAQKEIAELAPVGVDPKKFLGGKNAGWSPGAVNQLKYATVGGF